MTFHSVVIPKSQETHLALLHYFCKDAIPLVFRKARSAGTKGVQVEHDTDSFCDDDDDDDDDCGEEDEDETCHVPENPPFEVVFQWETLVEAVEVEKAPESTQRYHDDAVI